MQWKGQEYLEFHDANWALTLSTSLVGVTWPPVEILRVQATCSRLMGWTFHTKETGDKPWILHDYFSDELQKQEASFHFVFGYYVLDETSIFLQKETFGLVKMIHTHCKNKNPQQYRKYKTSKKLMTKPDPRDDLLTVW